AKASAAEGQALTLRPHRGKLGGGGSGVLVQFAVLVAQPIEQRARVERCAGDAFHQPRRAVTLAVAMDLFAQPAQQPAEISPRKLYLQSAYLPTRRGEELLREDVTECVS